MGSLSGWGEGIILSLCFIAVLGLVVAGFNSMYGQDNALPISDNTTDTLFVNYIDNNQANIQGGEVAFDATQGITVKSSWNIAKDFVTLIWTFINGGWIEKIAIMLNLGEAGMLLAHTLRIVWFVSVIFGILYALFKVAP